MKNKYRISRKKALQITDKIISSILLLSVISLICSGIVVITISSIPSESLSLLIKCLITLIGSSSSLLTLRLIWI